MESVCKRKEYRTELLSRVTPYVVSVISAFLILSCGASNIPKVKIDGKGKASVLQAGTSSTSASKIVIDANAQGGQHQTAASAGYQLHPASIGGGSHNLSNSPATSAHYSLMGGLNATF